MSDKILSPEEVKAKISQYQELLPTVVMDDLEKTLTVMKLSETKVDEILEKTIDAVSSRPDTEKVEEMSMKLDSLEGELSEIIHFLQNTQPQRMTQQLNSMSSGNPKQDYVQTYSSQSEVSKNPIQNRTSNSSESGKFQNTGAPALIEPEKQVVLLSDIKDDMMSKTILLKWVEFLINKVGRENLAEILDYYLDIGWINESIIMKVLAYEKGIEGPSKVKNRAMTIDEHMRSLLYIEKLKGKNIDHNTLSEIKREIEYGIERRVREI